MCVCVWACVCVCVSMCECVCVWLFATPWNVAWQAPLFMKFSRQEYQSGLPFPSRGDLPDSGIQPASLQSPALPGRFFTTVPPGKPISLSLYVFLPLYILICSFLIYFSYALVTNWVSIYVYLGLFLGFPYCFSGLFFPVLIPHCLKFYDF